MTNMTRLTASDRLRFLLIGLLLCEGGVHLQQYEGILHFVPTINTLFLLNAVSAAVIALALSASRDRIAIFTALGAIGMTVVALVSLAITRASMLFNYSEPTLRAAVALAAIVELSAILAGSAFIIAQLHEIGQRA